MRFSVSTSPDRIAQVEDEFQLQLLHHFSHLGVRHYQLPQDLDVPAAIQKLNALRAVEYAEPNAIHQLQAIPNDPRFPQQWALHNTGQRVNARSGPADTDIDWPEAIDEFSPDASVTVAVVDTGIALRHPDLTPVTWTNQDEALNGIDDDANRFVDDQDGWNFIDENRLPLDDVGHGTAVASVIGARSDDGIGIAGVTPAIELMALRVADELRGFGGPVVEVVNFVRATRYAAENGAQIINYSAVTHRRTNMEAAQVEWLADQDVLLVAAAGNGNLDSVAGGDNNDVTPVYPASYGSSNVISVAATGRDDTLTQFSNFGSTSVDITAPGLDIDTADVNRRIVLTEDFEEGAREWTIGNACSLGCPNWNLYTDFFGNTWATDGSFDLLGLPSNYLSFTDSWLESPWFQVLFGPRVVFRAWHELNLVDVLSVEASNDGATWKPIRLLFGRANSPCPDCSPFAGSFFVGDLTGFEGDQLKIRFRLLSDEAFQADGVYVDNVRVSDVNDFAFDGSQFLLRDGTSFSAPIVAGVAALIWAQRPDLSHRQVRQILLDSSEPLSSLEGKVRTSGRVNAKRALKAAIAFVPEPDKTLMGLAAIAVLLGLAGAEHERQERMAGPPRGSTGTARGEAPR